VTMQQQKSAAAIRWYVHICARRAQLPLLQPWTCELMASRLRVLRYRLRKANTRQSDLSQAVLESGTLHLSV